MIVYLDNFRSAQRRSKPKPPPDMTWVSILMVFGECRRFVCPNCRRLWYLDDEYVEGAKRPGYILGCADCLHPELWTIHEPVPDIAGRCIVVGANGDRSFIPTNPTSDVDDPKTSNAIDLAFKPDTYETEPSLSSEIEIASIYLRSTLGEFISIRARHAANGIRYRVVDEYGTKYRVPFRSSKETLTLGELIRFIDGTEHPGMTIPPGFPGGLVKCHYAFVTDGCEVEDAVFFARVSSEFYPELEDYYHQQAVCWVDEYLQDLDSEP